MEGTANAVGHASEVFGSRCLNSNTDLGADVESSLIEAARDGNQSKVKAFLQVLRRFMPPELVQVSSDDALVASVEQQHIEVVEYLLQEGADANCSIKGGPLLGLAIEKGDSDITELLLSRSAQKPARNNGSFHARQVKHHTVVAEVAKWQVFSFNDTTRAHCVALGISSIHVDTGSNLRVRACAEVDEGQRIFSITLQSWFTTNLKEAGCCCMEIATNSPDYQHGTFNTMDDHPWTEPQPKTSRRITFKRAYAAPPKVVVWFNSMDISSDGGWRVHTYATEVTETGFTINIDTWDDSKISSCGATWIAHPADMPEVSSGELPPRGHSSHENSGYVTFDSMGFQVPPRVLIGINKLDFDHAQKLRISAGAPEIMKERMRWHISTWDNIGSAAASYIAFNPALLTLSSP